MKTKKLLWLLLILATMVAAFAFTVSATDNASEPTLKIEGGNLSFEDSVFILYAVSHEGIAAEDVRLYFWNEPQSGDNAYAYDTADYSFAPYQKNVAVAGKSCVTFRNNTLRAKNMTDYVYARAYAEVDGVGYYSQVSKYSILQYAYNQLGKTAAGTSKQSLKDMLSAMLEYGAMAQIHFTYNTDRLANADFYQIKVEGGLLPDGFNKGLYLPGEKLTITAPEADGELVFSEWVNSAGESVSSEREYEITVGEANETYTAVYVEAVKYSEGLEFVSNGDGTCYVAGIGTCADTDLMIPSTSPAGDRVITVGYRPFYDFDSLTSVVIPDSVTSIGSYAFAYCDRLTSVVIPDSVTTIGSYAFFSCYSLTSIIVSERNTAYQSIDGNLYSKDGKTLLQYAIGKTDTSFEIPDSVTTIGEVAFEYCSNLTNVVIPDSVTSIGSYAFAYCYSLTSVVIGDSVTSIGSSAFWHCYKLVEVINHSSLEISAGSSNYGWVAYYAKEVHNGESKIDRVGDYLFYTYENVHYLLGYVGNDTELTLPANYKGESYAIYQYAFYDRDDLTSVVIPDSVTSIGDWAFAYCKSLTSIKYRGTQAQWNAISKGYQWNSNTGSYTITYNYVGE